MTYLIEILSSEKKKQTFRIEAKSEDEAKERLKLRLPAPKRENFTITCIKLDVSSINMDDMFGTFGGE